MHQIITFSLCLVTAGMAAADETPVLRIESGVHTAVCKWVGFTPDGGRLISAGYDNVVRVWDVRDPARPRLERSIRLQIGPGMEGKIFAAALSPVTRADGIRLLAVGGFPSRFGIRLINFDTGQVLGVLKGHSNVIHSLAFSADGKWLVSGSDDHTLKLRRLDGSASAPRGRSIRTLTGHSGDVMRVVCSPDGRYLASSSFDRSVRLWDAKDGDFVREIGRHSGPAGLNMEIAFSSDSRLLIAATSKFRGGSRVWRVPGGAEVARFDGHDNTVYSVGVPALAGGNGDGRLKAGLQRLLVASAGGNNNEIHLWDVLSGKAVGQIAGRGRAVFAVAFSEDGRRVGFGNTNSGSSLKANKPLEQAFDLLAMRPDTSAGSAAASSDTRWQRARLQAAGLSAERPEQNKLVICHGRAEVASITRRVEYDRIRCDSFSADGGQIVVGSNYNLTLHDTRSGKQLREFVGHTGTLWAVAVSPDGRLLVSGSFDQTFRIWNLETAELLVTVFAAFGDRGVGVPVLAGKDGKDEGRLKPGLQQAGPTDFVAWTPQGYSKASPGGDQLIGWHVNRGIDKAADFFFAWQFARTFDRPDVLENVLLTRNVDQALAIANAARPRAPGLKRDVTRDLAKLVPPSVTILEPRSGTSTTKATVRLKATIQTVTRDQDITNVRITVNGRPVERQKFAPVARKNAAASSGRVEQVELDVPPTAGENEFAVIASSAAADSQPVRVTVTREAVARQPALHVVSIGITKHEFKDVNTLKFPARHAQRVAAALGKHRAGLFRDGFTRTLTGTEATQRNIRRALGELAKSEPAPDDLAIVFISGHGLTSDSSEFFLIPHDYEGEYFSATAWTELLRPLSGLSCRVLLLMDTCHSGGLAAGRDTAIKAATGIHGGLMVMSSFTGDEVSLEHDDWDHGTFALAVIEGISGQRGKGVGSKLDLPADNNKDSQIEQSELSNYVNLRVKEITRGKQNSSHTPTQPAGQILLGQPRPVNVFQKSLESSL